MLSTWSAEEACERLEHAWYFDRLLSLFDHFVAEGFLLMDHRGLLRVDENQSRSIDALRTTSSPTLRDTWLKENERSLTTGVLTALSSSHKIILWNPPHMIRGFRHS